MNRITYDITRYNFAEYLKAVFNCDLESIKTNAPVFSREDDQSSPYHKVFYNNRMMGTFAFAYNNLIENIVKPLYNEPIAYQAIPTFRICFPNNVAVGEFHKDKNYRDPVWAKEVKEDNFFLPITDAFDTNTIWVESEEDKGDFAPINCKYGEIIQWDGSNLTHGNKINLTGKTRISIDFRVIRMSNYKPSEHGSINTGTKFKIGEYYKHL